MNDPSRVSASGPLGPFAAGFLHSLLELGYTPDSAASQLQLMAHLSRWLAGQGLDGLTLRRNDVERFLLVRRRAGYRHYLSEFSGSLRRTELVHPESEAVALRHPVMPIAYSPDGRFICVDGNQLRQGDGHIAALPADQRQHVSGTRIFGGQAADFDGFSRSER